MKTLKNGTLILLLLIVLQSCYTVQVVAPMKSDVKLANRGETLPIKETYKVWYVVWGAVPITKNKTDKMIEENGFTKVRITTKKTFLDIVISYFLGAFTIGTNTVIVEGEQSSSNKTVTPHP